MPCKARRFGVPFVQWLILGSSSAAMIEKAAPQGRNTMVGQKYASAVPLSYASSERIPFKLVVHYYCKNPKDRCMANMRVRNLVRIAWPRPTSDHAVRTFTSQHRSPVDDATTHEFRRCCGFLGYWSKGNQVTGTALQMTVTPEVYWYGLGGSG